MFILLLYLSSGIPGGQKKVFDSLELDLESVVSYLIWVLRTASVLNHGVISLESCYYIFDIFWTLGK